MQRAAKLTLKEFAVSFNNCRPPTGWGKRIAVAYSGGVDSTCLLYLVDNLIKNTESFKDLSVFAIHIDHGFRKRSQTDADHCRRWASERSIPINVCKIPWDAPPFNTLTVTDQNKEEMGRIARYHAIFNALKEEEVAVLLMAHHMDDQIETALMRQHRRKADNGETKLLGMAGMRPCRRWGMGNFPTHHLRYFGHEGMSRWICRPFLDFPKDRLIATANEENLAFVEDESNLDASLTERNAIRASIAEGREPLLVRPRSPLGLSRPSQQLPALHLPARDVVREYAALRDHVDYAVDEYLSINRHFSPEGTCLIVTSKDGLPPRVIQFGIILRILRYVSPFPWGSPHAEAGRSTDQLSRIANQLWPYSDVEDMQLYGSRGLLTARKKFCGGSGVLWHPTPIRGIPTPSVRSRNNFTGGLDGTYGWLAQRQPPPRKRSSVLDITAQLLAKDPFTVLWDSRWLCEFSENAIDVISTANISAPSVMTNEDARLVIAPRDQWWTPSVSYYDGMNPRKPHLKPLDLGSHNPPTVAMSFVRTIDAI